MKIGIDASLVVGEKSGVGVYTASLIEALARIDKKNQYILYPFFYHIFDPRFKQFIAPRGKFRVRFHSLPENMVRYLWFRSGIPKHWLLGRVDVLHSTTFCSPRRHPGRLVVTIHDISFLLYPAHHTEANRAHCLRGTLDAALWADRIIAVSENTKRDLMEYFNVSEDRIVVTLQAARKEFHPRPKAEVSAFVSKRWDLNKPYVLSVGTVEPRKNMQRLIRAFCSLGRDILIDFQLVVAGGKGWLTSDIYQYVERLGGETRVRFLGYVPEEDLPWLYCGAECFIYPSIYEGFGLPPMEAMASGIPVIASRTSSLPEVVGEAGVLVDPLSEEEIGAAIESVLSNASLRSELSSKGLKRAASFSWERTAQQTLRTYEEL